MTMPGYTLYDVPQQALPAAPEFTMEEILNQQIAQSPGLMNMRSRGAGGRPAPGQMAPEGLTMPAPGLMRGNLPQPGQALMQQPVPQPNEFEQPAPMASMIPQMSLPSAPQAPVSDPNVGMAQAPPQPPNAAPMQPQGQPGLLGRIARTGGRGLARLFGSGQGLDPDEQGRQGWNALTDFGLSMMAGAGPAPWGQPHDTMGQAIAKGVMAGRQGYAGRAGEARRRGWQQEVAERMKDQGFEAMSPGQWDRLMVEAMEYAPDLVTSLSEVRKSLAQQSGTALRPIEVETLDNEGNPITELMTPTGETIATRPREPSSSSMTAPTTKIMVNAAGKRTIHQWDGNVRDWVDTGRDPGTLLTEAQGKAAAFIPLVMGNRDILDEFVDEPPAILGQLLSGTPVIRRAAGELNQRMKLAGNIFAEAWLRQTTGAAYNSEELANSYELFVPKYDDLPPTLKQKQLNRDLLEMMLNVRAGGRRMSDQEERYVADLIKNVQTAGGNEIRRKLRNGEELTEEERATLESDSALDTSPQGITAEQQDLIRRIQEGRTP